MRSQSSSILPHISEPSYSPLGDNKKGSQRLMHYPWKKIAIGAALFVTLLWFFSGSSGSSSGDPTTGYTPAPPLSDDSLENAKPPASSHDDASWPVKPLPPAPPHYDDDLPVKQPNSSPSPGTMHPTSPETDPDRSSTTYCTKPHSSSAKLVQYALMIDAGSQGSRIHVYKFNNCKPSLSLEYEVFVQKQPGLSKYAGDPIAAAESLDSLMDEAVKVVPKDLVKCTPVAVKATAGLRLLGTSQAAEILAAVRHRLSNKYDFELPTTSADGLEDRVAIMDGKDEGVYAWITSNYLLGTIGPSVPAGTSSYAVLDLGGASTQIVFEPTFSPNSKEKLAEGEHKYSLTFGGKSFTLYQHSYLGYGLMRARQSIHLLVEYMGDIQAANHNTPLKTSARVLANPCISQGGERIVTFDVDTTKERNVTMAGHDISSFSACQKLISLVLAKDSVCSVKPCSFDGTYQPSIIDTFPKGGILALSYFTDRLQPFIQAGLIGTSSSTTGSTMSISSIASLAEKVCLGKPSWTKSFSSSKEVIAELEGHPERCLDLTFMHSLLRLGYEFGDERTVRLEKKIDGVELGWALGAALALLDGQLSCRI